MNVGRDCLANKFIIFHDLRPTRGLPLLDHNKKCGDIQEAMQAEVKRYVAFFNSLQIP